MVNSRILWIALIISSFSPWSTSAQSAECNYAAYLDSCKTHINDDHFNFLKEYEIDNEYGAKQKVEYSIALIEGFDYEYYFTGFKEGHQEVVATLYDSKRKELGTNKHHKNFVHVIQHKCEKTGIYYITFTFEDEEEYCGAAVLGFAKHEAEK